VSGVMDRAAGRSKEVGFVENGHGRRAQSAITAMNGGRIEGKPLAVNKARPTEPRAGEGRAG
jgi:cold-inducible RNA-binding protein